MTFKPNERQALFLWKMIAGETAEEREPMKSKAQPDIKRDRKPLIDQGFLSVERRKTKNGRHADFLVPTNAAWEWAAQAFDVEIMSSKVAASALQGLLRRLLPFLSQNELPLAAVFAEEAPEAPPAQSEELPRESVSTQIEKACLSLAGGTKKARVRLSALRRALPAVSREQLDRALVELQRRERLVLYRDDNTPALTAEDHAAALIVGDSPRHLVYLEA